MCTCTGCIFSAGYGKDLTVSPFLMNSTAEGKTFGLFVRPFCLTMVFFGICLYIMNVLTALHL